MQFDDRIIITITIMVIIVMMIIIIIITVVMIMIMITSMISNRFPHMATQLAPYVSGRGGKRPMGGRGSDGKREGRWETYA